MLSPKQKKALFGASIESRPRYVRVPLQMVNSVRELNTDVNFARLVAQFEQTDCVLAFSGGFMPIHRDERQ